MNGTPRTRTGLESFTLIELLVVIGIIALLAAMLFPVLTSARVRSYDADCSSNLRQIGVALYGYSTEAGGGYFPLPDTGTGTNSYAGPHTNLVKSLMEYVPADSPVWHCKRYLKVNDLSMPANRTNTTYFYWAWNTFLTTVVPMSSTVNSSRWFSVGLATNVAGAVLMSDRFETSLLGSTAEKQYHAGTKVNVAVTQPGTMLLLTGNSVIKASPTQGQLE